MKNLILSSWELVMDNQHNPLRHLDRASQHYFMQVLGWMWSMVFSLAFLSIFHFGYVWLAHLLVIGGFSLTIAIFKEAEKEQVKAPLLEEAPKLSGASRCVWDLEKEA